jgi:hypothetical protein
MLFEVGEHCNGVVMEWVYGWRKEVSHTVVKWFYRLRKEVNHN